MTEVVAALRRFILRDAMLAVGGAWVISSLLRVLKYEIPQSVEWWRFVLVAGAAYAVGFAVQDGTSVFQVTRTSHLRKAYPPFTWLYYLFIHRPWQDIDDQEDLLKRDLTFRSRATESEQEDYGRILTLKQLGTTMGSSAVVSAIIFLVWGEDLAGVESKLAWSAFGVGIVLILLGWIKLAQQPEFLMNHPKSAESRS